MKLQDKKHENLPKNSDRKSYFRSFGSLLRDDGLVHLLLPASGSVPAKLACCRSISSVADSSYFLPALFFAFPAKCRECLDHFYASEFAKERDANLSDSLQEKS